LLLVLSASTQSTVSGSVLQNQFCTIKVCGFELKFAKINGRKYLDLQYTVDRHTTKTVTSIQRTQTHCYETRLKTASGSFSRPYSIIRSWQYTKNSQKFVHIIHQIKQTSSAPDVSNRGLNKQRNVLVHIRCRS